ncbi:flagellar basal body rod protein FlgB [Candidatus Endoriftia persephone]|jgi:flagellar basal-body rod protein FlgB|uniref:Flagellar basal body rod protein FlgB n=3 Tax=Gammaproteobacteria TaxID=1236 RepID=G2FB39_9GAMM|nr:flagellar basal body rod protein FlgB [Candidatus Endoriftia persephone]EGW55977.1 flagellar basal-body rod protein FlgB [endosymbiont of Tevnia jerichonana (vent Tica)]USF88109.1 flagellar basal body rod protein FlgB [Candidatus Endoriftia persephone]
MNLDDAFGIHPQALLLRARRSELIASNLANADTPGYKARDFDFHKVLQQAQGEPVRLRTTHPSHIQDEQGVVPPTQMLYRIPSQPSLDGNTVETEREQSTFASNSLEYQASLRFLNGKISSLRQAIKGE